MSNPLRSAVSKVEFSSSYTCPPPPLMELNISSPYFVENPESMTILPHQLQPSLHPVWTVSSVDLMDSSCYCSCRTPITPPKMQTSGIISSFLLLPCASSLLNLLSIALHFPQDFLLSTESFNCK